MSACESELIWYETSKRRCARAEPVTMMSLPVVPGASAACGSSDAGTVAGGAGVDATCAEAGAVVASASAATAQPVAKVIFRMRVPFGAPTPDARPTSR
ncbi:hypothetical protein D9M73_103580 [compost metagenome]